MCPRWNAHFPSDIEQGYGALQHVSLVEAVFYFGSLIFYLRRNFLDPVLDPIGRFIREKCRPSGILGDLVDYLVTAFVGALVYTTVVIFLSARIYLVVEAF